MKSKIKVAGGSFNRSISRNHYTTMGFGQLFPVYAEQALPNDNFTISPILFGRSQPSIVPTLSKLSVVQRCFFVSYQSVWRHWNNFINGLPIEVDDGFAICKRVPTFTSKDICDIFIDQSQVGEFFDYRLAVPVSLESIQSEEGAPFDIAFQNNLETGLVSYYRLTDKGKLALKILQSLGYNFQWSSSSESSVYRETYNALDLFAFYKVIYDRYLPSQFRVNSDLDLAFQEFNNLEPDSSGFISVPKTLLSTLLQHTTIYYDNNYFTSQWYSLNEPVPNYIAPSNDEIAEGQLNQSDHTANVKANSQDVAINPSTVPTTATRNIMMASLRRYIMRMGLVGSRPVDRYFTQFGVRVPELEMSMCKYCGSIETPVQMMDVVSTGDSESLGDLAGKSFVANDDGQFKVSCDQHGLVLILASIDVPSQFTSGVRRRCLHLYPFDFYTPDFDDTTLQATAGSELFGQLLYYSPNINTTLIAKGLKPSQIFGFTARYDEYRKPIDDITGDFNVPSLNTTIDGYVNPRRLYDRISLQNAVEVEAQKENPSMGNIQLSDFAYSSDVEDTDFEMSPALTLKQDDALQFNRIYKDMDGIGDPLRCHFKFGVNVNGVVKPSDLALFVDGNGKDYTTEKNGAKFD